MKRKAGFFLLFLVSATLFCGKRALPTSPDRWAPKIAGVVAVDRNHINCVFSEKMARESFRSALQFNITNTVTGETVPVIAVVLGSDDLTAHLTSLEMDTVEYILSCESVTDISGNYIRPLEKTFRGSSAFDTTPPLIVSLEPKIFDIEDFGDSALRVEFSEPIDTSSVSEALFFTGNAQISFSTRFSADLAKMEIFFPPDADTAEHKMRLYPLVLNGFKDIAGNKMPGFMNIRIIRGTSGFARNITLFCPDTLFRGFIAVTGDSPEFLQITEGTGGKNTIPILVGGDYRALAIWTRNDSFFASASARFTADSTLPEMFIELDPDEFMEIDGSVRSIILRLTR
ncbi:Ig-like domain-containing protein [candidate division WOR-3 bacterium]|nr:Ig-like domain-containing protein [candidate division WOR-3 bacterium]